ncbi:MAG: hypothetical protein AAGH64_04970 [Planctomycetota bacterium]
MKPVVPTKTAALGLLAFVVCAHAQSPRVTLNLPDFDAIQNPGTVVPIPTGLLLPSSDFVAFRFTADYTALQSIVVPSSSRFQFFDPRTGDEVSDRFTVLTDVESRLDNGESTVIEYVGVFSTNPATLDELEALVRTGGSSSATAEFANPVLEFFTPDDIPDIQVGGGPLDPSAPTPAIDLGVINVAGSNTVLDFTANPFDATAALYSGSGEALSEDRVSNAPLRGLENQLIDVGRQTVDLLDDATVAFTTLAPGEYLAVVLDGFDRVFDGFEYDKDGPLTDDLVINANGLPFTVTADQYVDDAALFTFTVAPVDADFDQDGAVTTDDVTLFFDTFDRGVADYNQDGGVDFFDAAGFLDDFAGP